jgi:hydrogenase maturation protein HypF
MAVAIEEGCDLVARRLRVEGHVQGVGFRPFVKRLADELDLRGAVGNDAGGVFIDIEGMRDRCDEFRLQLRAHAPAAARIEAIRIEETTLSGRTRFEVSSNPPPGAASISARAPRDRAVCENCLAECRDSRDRRCDYPFTACAECGPRYSVLRQLPYDRDATSMRSFQLCPTCSAEFFDPADRRFIAELTSCPACGPHVVWVCGTEKEVGGLAIEAAADALNHGAIVAIKGLGGYQFLVRADDSNAVARLRQRKHRPSKPLAVMVRTPEDAITIAELSESERAVLTSAENPIVLLRKRSGVSLADNIAPGIHRLGVLLPTTPLHHLLLDRIPFPIVATSGNRGEEPILGDQATSAQLFEFADAILTHNRPIVRTIDDSVVQVIGDRVSSVRLARGYAPLPLPTLERWLKGHRPPKTGVLAVGGQQKNAVALWTGNQAILGPHFGDLDGARGRSDWVRHVAALSELYRTTIETLIADGHPDYFATRWANEQKRPVLTAMHHHAHAAAAMIEHDLLDRRIIALTWDGTGLGPDGSIWGGEIVRATLDECERIATLRPIPLPGGDAAVRQPWRIGAALMHAVGQAMDDQRFSGIRRMIESRTCCPMTTSLGRLFDGVAHLILGVADVSYEGEAAAWLEASADGPGDESYPIAIEETAGIKVWDWRPTVRALLADRAAGVLPGVMAKRFHESVVDWACAIVSQAREADVVLGGGCFQNVLLTERVSNRLEAIGKRVHRPGLIPANDGGLAAGQLAIGLARLTS